MTDGSTRALDRRGGARRDFVVPLLAAVAVLLLALLASPWVRARVLPSAEERFRPELPFTRLAIDRAGPTQPFGKDVGDVDGDGDPDLLAGAWEAGGLAWYENPGWRRHVVASGEGFTSAIGTCDLDRDGDLDVVSLRGDGIAWYANPSWTARAIAREVASDMVVIDVEGDGDCDVVSRGQTEYAGSGHRLAAHTQEGGVWTSRIVEVPKGEGLATADLDRDGDPDLVTNRVWLENVGGAGWRAHEFAPPSAHPNARLTTADIDGDGRVDIVLAPAELRGERARFSWFEAPPDPRVGPWREHVIADDVEAVLHSAVSADFDGDGDTDVATAEMGTSRGPHRITVLLNADGRGLRWRAHVIGIGGSHNLVGADIDADGDVDLFGGNFDGIGVHLFRNDAPRRAR